MSATSFEDATPAVAPGTDGEPRIVVRGLRKTFKRRGGAAVPAIDDIDLTIAPGEFLVLLGPSGCGKTTLLRCLAGLETPDQGEIAISGTPVYSSGTGVDLPPERRPASMMFQSYALWPHMTAFDNVAFPLRSRARRVRPGRAQVTSAVEDVLGLVGVADLRDQYPGQMSGGQQQRVSLARSLVAGEEVVLFDEPLSNVDAKVRDQLRIELLDMQQRLGFTAIYVTHDQHEAMSMASRIVVLNNGRVEQVGSPREIYRTPATPFVARFIGTTNEVPGERTGPTTFSTELGEITTAAAPDLAPDHEFVLAVRPERCTLSVQRPAGPNVWRGTIDIAMYAGARNEYVVDVGERKLLVWTIGEPLEQGEPVWVSCDPADVRPLQQPATAGTPS
jgi:iron(III) transport system ATP-binding protein